MTLQDARNLSFQEASEEQNHFIAAQIETVQNTVRDFVIGVLSTVAVLVIVVGFVSYQIRSHTFSAVYTIVCIVLTYLYVTSGVKLFNSIKNSSRIPYDRKKLGDSFLVCDGQLVSKQEAKKRVYTVTAVLKDGTELTDVVMPKEYYDSVRFNEKLLLAMSDRADSCVLAFPAFYWQKNRDSQADTDSGYLYYERKITAAELADIEDQFRKTNAAYNAQFNKIYISIIGVCLVITAVCFAIDHSSFAYLFVFCAGLMGMILISEHLELRSFNKKTKNVDDIYVVDAVVGNKSRSDENVHWTQFYAKNSHTVIYTSMQKGDYDGFAVHEKVLLVIFGNERPVIFHAIK